MSSQSLLQNNESLEMRSESLIHMADAQHRSRLSFFDKMIKCVLSSWLNMQKTSMTPALLKHRSVSASLRRDGLFVIRSTV